MLAHRIVSWFRRSCRPAVSSRSRLALEKLEDRTTPTVAANGLYVSSLYQGLLGREADPAGLAYFTANLDAGGSRTQVAQVIATSNEALAYDVNQFYVALLGRSVDTPSLGYWLGGLKAGGTLDQVKGGILGSAEFFDRAGGTNEGFIDALFSNELGRSADPYGLSYFEGQLNAGATREHVADAVLGTVEAQSVKVDSIYRAILGRPADAFGVNYWTSQLEHWVPETQVVAGLFGSPEFFRQVQGAAATTGTIDANQAAAELIASNNLFTAPLPNAEYLILFRPEANQPSPIVPTDPGNPDPGPADPGNSDPCPTDPGNSDPGPTDPGNPDPGPTDPVNTDPGPTDPGNNDPGPSCPVSTDPGPTDPGNNDPGPTDPGNNDPGNNDPGPTDPGDNGGDNSGGDSGGNCDPGGDPTTDVIHI
jgi:hypothetical protein